jgi:hypothetical protein
MIVCFDSSAINHLLDDVECELLTQKLLTQYDIYISGLNVIELARTADPERR